MTWLLMTSTPALEVWMLRSHMSLIAHRWTTVVFSLCDRNADEISRILVLECAEHWRTFWSPRSSMSEVRFPPFAPPSDYSTRASSLVADVLAMGAISAVIGCGGPAIPFRAGRIDATEAGPETVPEPQQDLASHIESFRRQGFSATEMISLVACGHSLGMNAQRPRIDYSYVDS
jgi:hypothetical protein